MSMCEVDDSKYAGHFAFKEFFSSVFRKFSVSVFYFHLLVLSLISIIFFLFFIPSFYFFLHFKIEIKLLLKLLYLI